MEIVVIASSVTPFYVAVADDEGLVIHSTNSLACNVISTIENFISLYEVTQIRVKGEGAYVKQIIKELQEVFSVIPVVEF